MVICILVKSGDHIEFKNGDFVKPLWRRFRGFLLRKLNSVDMMKQVLVEVGQKTIKQMDESM